MLYILELLNEWLIEICVCRLQREGEKLPNIISEMI